MPPYAFATIHTDAGDRATLVLAGQHYRLDRLLPDEPATGLRPWVDRWDELLDRVDPLVAGLENGSGRIDALVEAPSVLSPIRFPNKLVCVGGVYSDHLAQMGLPVRRAPRMPIFLRAPTTSIVGPGRTIRIPGTTQQFDWEIELAVVLARRLTLADEAEASAAIAGYSVGIDFSCRDLLHGELGVDLVRAKAQDGMAPVGPVVTPARFIGNPQDLGLRLSVNGVQRQNSSTANMLYSIAEQLATISRYITLEPGDIVFTGSPAGSADGEGDFLKPGDRVSAEIDRIGTLDLDILAPIAENVAVL